MRKGLDANFIANERDSKHSKRAVAPAATAHYFRREKEHELLVSESGITQEAVAARKRQGPDCEDNSLGQKIDLITNDIARQYKTRLKAIAAESKEGAHNVSLICDHIIDEINQINAKASTREGKTKTLLGLRVTRGLLTGSTIFRIVGVRTQLRNSDLHPDM